ncbi:respiratory burst oxidase homolog protein F-like [Papaver somniferum]|uniref:respiratory burst oxidase homolog protein F-like n=1 Tax=Papaver somniferum TaxID=3469 RepID=UPI000E6FF5FD|nr:respiratory burst oxidase homolog protein F-like [Papaver somniferum]
METQFQETHDQQQYSLTNSSSSSTSSSSTTTQDWSVPASPGNNQKNQYSQQEHDDGVGMKQLRFFDSLNCVGGDKWKDVEQRFDQFASLRTGLISRSDFAYCIGMKDTPDFAEELLNALRGRKDLALGISKAELHDHWCRITDPEFDSRARVFFDLCDRNLDGKITQKEIKQVILLSAATNKLYITQEVAEEYAALLMEELDSEHHGYIQLSQLETLFKDSLSKSAVKTQTETITLTENTVHESHEHYEEPMTSMEIAIRTYWRRAWIVIVWLLICFGLFVWKFMQYRERKAFQVMGYCLCTSKGAAETLKFNMALILLPVCRNTITLLRRNRTLNYMIPFNDNINFHKLIAGGIVIAVILHGGTHLTCDFPRIAGCSRSVFRRTIAVHFGNHQPSYYEILATTEVATGLGMVILMAIAFILATHVSRRKSSTLPQPLRKVTGYNTFWYSHHLFILVYVLLIIHSMFLFLTKDISEKTTWMYIAIPVLLYAGERIVRAIRSEFDRVEIVKATTYPGKVLSLKMSKPAGFTYRSGMYLFLNCPDISPFEWHPLSLTSAPEDDHLSVHIRTLGDWSYQIYSRFQEAIVSGNPQYPEVYIDGPYGASSQDHVKYDIVVLIGLGIGATPFISVIKDIIHNTLRKPAPVEDEESGISNVCSSKAYMYWVTREQSSFGWFRDVMKEISEKNQNKAVIEMHNYLTSVYQDGDARSALISIIQSLHHQKNGIDVLSHTPVHTHFARPNWSEVLSNLSTKHEGARIGVFYCGPSVLAKELQRLCTKMSSKTTTRFVFHKEHY